MNNEIPYNQIAKFITGNCTPGEAELVTNWMNHSPENEKLFNDLYEIWENTGDLNHVNHFDTSKALHKINAGPGAGIKKTTAKRLVVPGWLKIAAGFILVAVFMYLFSGKINGNQELLVYTTGDNIEKFSLEDGSTVWLNRQSKLSCPARFNGKSRHVGLAGEAYFEISKNPEKPFIIETATSNITVLGTSFNVMARGDSEQTVVSVSTGKVRFSSKTDVNNKVLLEKGEMASLENSTDKLEKKNIADANILSWKTGILDFQDIPFEKAINDISIFYDKNIVIKDQGLNKMLFNSYFDNQPFDVILEVLKSHRELEVNDSSGTITIVKK